VSGQLAVKLEKLRQQVAGAGFDAESGGRCSLAGFKFNPKPPRSGTLPSLLPILPG
jgi:hypothetical protein